MKTVVTLFTYVLAASVCAVTSPSAHAAPPPAILKTSVDCAKARTSVEKLVCRDPQLLRMDTELIRLYRLTLTDDHSVPPPDRVMIDQQSWTESRNQCASEREPKTCAIRRYAERAYQLRQGSAVARTKDPDSLTEGPLAFRCTGFDGLMTATFFNALPGVVYLKWPNTSITLSQLPSDSGTHYAGKDSLGNYSFGRDGDLVLFQKPGAGEVSCTAEPAG